MKRRDNKVGNSDGKVGRELTYLNEFKLTIDIFCQISNTVIRMEDISNPLSVSLYHIDYVVQFYLILVISY